VGDGPINDVLKPLIEEVRNRQGDKSRKVLAAECGLHPSDLAHFLNDERIPSPFALANLAKLLGMDVARTLAVINLFEARRELAKARETSSTSARLQGWDLAANAYHSLFKASSSEVPAAPSPVEGLGTLENWRDWIFPAAVVVGDRRERPPRSPADLLAASGSAADYFNIARVKLRDDTQIVSDKTTRLLSEDDETAHERLTKRFGNKNLIVIGSPACNLMARAINDGACFSFRCEVPALESAKRITNELITIEFDQDELQNYARAENEKLRETIFGFAQHGILDLVDRPDRLGIRKAVGNSYRDYGVVSLCRHPWSTKHVAVMVAGVHGPGTAAAVKLFADQRAFVDRPLGGIFKTFVPNDLLWDDRFPRLRWEWDTHSYDLDKFAKEFESYKQSESSSFASELKFWEAEHVGKLLDLIRSGR
jgi:hypothetical protein